MPTCAPLAAAIVPAQASATPRYSNSDALTRGTLFPGLDLPFLNKVNKTHPYAGTPLGELMALEFIVKELNLYLDTHAGDEKAFTLMRSMTALLKEAHERYVELFGPVTLTDLAASGSYTWLSGPWPWEYDERTGD
ncbi:MAG: spore coat protein CotJB [Oscillospiraceae bacterium]|nr:spore coat protein CotJB [Oscillospiraceae bacterium]